MTTETSKKIKKALKEVIDEGTGFLAKIPGLDLYGKTGTAEKKPGSKEYLMTFEGYFEYKKNITNTSSEISNLIRMGAISREQGLQDVYNMCLDGRRPTNVINDFIAYLGITDEEFEYYSNKKLSLCEKLQLLKLVKYGREIMRWITGQEKLPKRGKFVRL